MTTLITEGLFRVDGDRAVLLASRRRSSGAVKFPAERPELFDGDPDIQNDIEPIELSTEGTLYTYTTQEFPPPLPYKGNRDPKVFKPYVVGFVELRRGRIGGDADRRRDRRPADDRSPAGVDHHDAGNRGRSIPGDLRIPPGQDS